MSIAIHLENLTLGYDRHPAVHHVNGKFMAGTLTAVTGPNGAGKSTLLKAIAGILAPQEGRISFTPPSPVAYLPQAAQLQRDFPLTVLQMAATGFWNQAGSFKAISRALQTKARAALTAVGLEGFGHRQLQSLSAGQFQRALFARLLLQDAPVILLDEPFAAIDSDTTARLIEIVLAWHKEGRTVLCVLHDIDQIKRYFPNCLLMARECVAWGSTRDVLQPDNLRKARFFHEAWADAPEVCAQ